MPYVRRRKSAPKRKSSKPYVRRARRSNAKRLPRRAIRSSNFSTIHEEYSFGIQANTTTPFVVQMSSLLRAQQLAPFFQEYKITSVKLMFRPKWDTFPATGLAAEQLPYLLYQTDCSSSVPNNITYQDFISMGVKPVRFDDKTITRYMPPCVIMNSTLSSPTVLPALIKKSPWLPTSSTNGGPWTLNDVVHHGATFQITGVTPADVSNYVVTVGVTCLFRKPIIQTV